MESNPRVWIDALRQSHERLLGLVGPSLSRKKDAMHILGEIDVQVQRYLLVMLVSNALTGIGTWLAFAALGHVSGDVAAQDILTGVFARFCIGK